MGKEKLIITPKRPKGEDGTKSFTVRIKEEIVDQLDELSRKSGRSRNSLVSMLLEFALENCEVETN